MQFVEVFDNVEASGEDGGGDSAGESLRSFRQRMIAAQIRDSEIGEENLDYMDNFDSSVENKVSANESTLMEMDEIITQIQQWRNNIVKTDGEDESEIIDKPEEYKSEAYDRLFGSHTQSYPAAPECDDGADPDQPFVHIEDIDMVAKLQSLQDMIRERQSAVSIEAHKRHVAEYSSLRNLLRSKFGEQLGVMDDVLGDSDNSDSDDSGNSEIGSGYNSDADGEHITSTRINKKLRKYNNNNSNYKTNSNGNTLISKNNNYEEERCSSTSREDEGYAERNHSKQKRPYQPPTASRATAAAAGLLESEFQAIDLEVKNSILGAGECRQREDDVIREGADLEDAVLNLEDSLRDFTGDLDRLLG